VASVISALAGAYLAITWSTANLANWGQWLRDFAQSPGAAASAALIAAGIAYTGIKRQVMVSRDTLTHQKNVAEASAWWSMFEWASDRAIPPRQSDRPLPSTVTISTLQQLAESATSEVQKIACAGVIGAVSEHIDPHPIVPPPDTETASSESDDSTFAALASYVESSRGTPAASAVAEALVYENEVLKALVYLSWDDPALKILRNPPADRGVDSGADAVADVGGQRVVIQIKNARKVEGLRSRVAASLKHLQTRGDDTDRYLVITPFPSLLRPEQEAELNAVVTHWRLPSDTASLKEALYRAAALDHS
jgi:hypothetical protein